MQLTGYRRLRRTALRWVRGADDLFRRHTGARRALPDFIIIGGMRCGSTSLFNWLRAHSRLVGSLVKEVHFFDTDAAYSQGLRHYRSYFPLRRPAPVQYFEASPRYLFDPRVPERIADALPQVRMIALLRNPVDRALSQYFHQVKRGREHRAIEAALFDSTHEPGFGLPTGPACEAPEFVHFRYLSRSRYVDQIQRYFNFFPREQILFLESEAMYALPAEALRTVCNFLEVESMPSDAVYPARNVGTYGAKVPPSMTDALTEYFRPHNRELFDLLGRRFDWPA